MRSAIRSHAKGKNRGRGLRECKEDEEVYERIRDSEGEETEGEEGERLLRALFSAQTNH